VVNFLVFSEGLVDSGFQGTTRPHQSPVFLFFLLYFSESIILQSISNYFHFIVVELEVVATIRRLIRSYRDMIFIGSENKKLLFDLGAYFFISNAFLAQFCILGVFLIPQRSLSRILIRLKHLVALSALAVLSFYLN